MDQIKSSKQTAQALGNVKDKMVGAVQSAGNAAGNVAKTIAEKAGNLVGNVRKTLKMLLKRFADKQLRHLTMQLH